MSSLEKNDERQDYLRAKFQKDGNGKLAVSPYDYQDSSMISVFANADALIVRPPFDKKIEVGATVLGVALEAKPLPPVRPGGVAFFAFLLAAPPGSEGASGETTAGPMSCVSPPGVTLEILPSFCAGAAPTVGCRGLPFTSKVPVASSKVS